MAEMTPLVYSVREVAELLQVSPQTIWAMVWDGRLFSVKLGARRVVPRKTVEQFLDCAEAPARANGLRAGLQAEMKPR